jgi:pyrroloquinoline quinone biosynthesis protein D
MSNDAAIQPTDIVELNPMFLFRWEEPQQAHVLLYPEGLVKLNPTAGQILEAVAQTVTVGDLTEIFRVRYDNMYNKQDIEKDILAFLEASRERGWIRIKR